MTRENCKALFSLSLLLLSLSLVSCSIIPLPPRQNTVQAGIFEQAKETAKTASDAAVPQLLALFDSPAFRSQVADLPQIATANASVILALAQSIISNAAQYHNFAPSLGPLIASGGPPLDVDLTGMSAAGFVPNYYTSGQVGLLPYIPILAYVQNFAELAIFSYPPFENFSAPTLEEALTRPTYSCLNVFGIAGGCVPYGDISLSFARGWSQNMTVLSPVDSGYYTACCKLPANVSDSVCTVPIDCSAWDGTLGTLTDFNHLIMANAGFWKLNVSDLFRQYYQPINFPVTPADFVHTTLGYMEGTIAGNVPFPQGISHVEAGASQLLGTDLTETLRQWASSNSWPLIWTAGMAVPKKWDLLNTTIYDGLDVLDMFLDPFTVATTTDLDVDSVNLTLSQQQFSEFETIARTYLSENSNAIHDGTFWAKSYSLLSSAIDSGLLVRFPKVTECQDNLDNCFAVQISTGACVCNKQTNLKLFEVVDCASDCEK